MIDEHMIEEIKPKKDATVYKSAENDIMNRLNRVKFIELLESSGINMEMVANGKRNKNEEFHKFNIFIDTMNNDENISMIDICMILEETYFDMKTIIKCFNEENEYALRDEVARAFNVKRFRSKLEKIIS
jgi:hypothetical protein